MDQYDARLAEIETFIGDFPVCEYALMRRDELIFSPAVRTICETDCPRFGHSWACPPAIGTIDACMARCAKYDYAFLFSTVAEVADSFDMQGCLNERRDHEGVTYAITERFKQAFGDVLTLSTGCMLCDTCAYPDAPCRNPARAYATIESHGILIMQTAAMQNMTYDCGANIVTYFSLLLFN